MPDALSYFAVLALVALASSHRGRVARSALRWLSGEALRSDGDGSLRARGVRAARRSGSTAAALAAAWGAARAPEVTLPVLGALAGGGAGYGAYRASEWQRRRSHHRRWVRPAYMAAQDIARWPESEHPSKWLTVAPDRSLVTAKLPVGWKGEPAEQARLSQVLAARLGIDSPVVRYQLAGHAPKLELTQSPPPPGRTVFADAAGALGRAKDDEWVWGRGKQGAWVTTSLSGDSPHAGLSMGSGAGKSWTARWLLAQMLHRGAVGLVLDSKWLSHMWAEGLPNVAVAHREKDIHAALVWLGAEIARRNEVAFAGADIEGNVSADVGPRIIVLAEELNDTMKALRTWWRENRAASDAVRPPSLDALDKVSFTGRQVRVHMVYIGQALSAAAMGGGRDSTESMGVIAFARTRPRTWKMLAPDHPMPKMSQAPGRVYVVSDEVRECQAVLMTGEEAREYALSGTVSPLPYGMPGAPVQAAGGPVQAGTLALRSGADLGFVSADLGFSVSVVSPGTPAALTLREAVGAGVLRMSLAAARKARTRDATFPADVGRDGTAELYDPAALAAWASERK